MSAAVQMRAITVVRFDGGRRALPHQLFATNAPHAAELLRQGAAVLVDERDLSRIAGREADLYLALERRAA